MVMPMRTKPSAIAREIQQTRKFSGPAEEASVALLRTADVLRGDLDRSMADADITLQQFNVLRILRGSHPEAIATLEIAERMIERAPGITRLLDRLEAVGLVSRQRCRDDRRRVLCTITRKGLDALERADEPVRVAERRRFKR